MAAHSDFLSWAIARHKNHRWACRCALGASLAVLLALVVEAIFGHTGLPLMLVRAL